MYYLTIQQTAARTLLIGVFLTAVTYFSADLVADEVVVVSESAPVLIEASKVGEIHRGQKFEVLQRSGPWVAIRFKEADQTIRGWVFSNHLQSTAEENEAPSTPTAVAAGIELELDSLQVSLQGSRRWLTFRLRIRNSGGNDFEIAPENFELLVGRDKVKADDRSNGRAGYYSGEQIITRLDPNGQLIAMWPQPQMFLSKENLSTGQSLEKWIRFPLTSIDDSVSFEDLHMALQGQLAGNEINLDLKEIAKSQLDARSRSAKFEESVTVVDIRSELNALNFPALKQVLDQAQNPSRLWIIHPQSPNFFVDPYVRQQLSNNRGGPPGSSPFIVVLPKTSASQRFPGETTFSAPNLRLASTELEAVLTVLGERPDKVPLLLSYLDHEDAELRATVAAILAPRCNEARVSASLIEAAGDSSASVRATALMAMVGISQRPNTRRTYPTARNRGPVTDEVTAAIVAAMEDPEVNVRTTAARVAGGVNSPAIIRSLIASLQDENDSVVATACSSLGSLKAQEASQALQKLRQQDNIQKRAWAIRALGSIGTLTPLETALAQLEEGVASYSEFQTLEKEKNAQCVEPLIGYLKRPSTNQQYVDQAAKILGDLGDKRATQVLLQQLHFGNAYSQEVPRALGKLGVEDAIQPLWEASRAQSRNSQRQVAIFEALLRLGDDQAFKHVMQLMANPDPSLPVAQLLPVLAFSDNPLATRLLARQLDDERNHNAAAKALLEQASPVALRMLDRKLSSKNYKYGGNILANLYQSQSPERFQLIYLASKSENPMTRQAANNFMRRWAPEFRLPQHQRLIGQEMPKLKIGDWVVGPSVGEDQLKDNVVLLNFWALWCDQSWSNFRKLDDWQRRYADDGLVVLSLSGYDGFGWDPQSNSPFRMSRKSKSDEVQALAELARQKQIQHRMAVLASDPEWRDLYAIVGLPQLVLIDRTGRIELIRVGELDDTREIEDAIRKKLYEVDFENAFLTEEKLARLQRTPTQVLSLRAAKFNPVDVQLSDKKGLRALHLDGSEIDSDGIRQLLQGVEWTNLKTLTLSGTDVDNSVLEILSELPALEVLHIGCSRVTDKGLQTLSELSQLKELSLGDKWGSATITSRGLSHLAAVPNLEEIQLNGIDVSDDAVLVLGELPALKSLSLIETKISESGLKQLANLRPTVNVVADQWTEWLSQADYQRRFFELSKQNRIPIEVQGKLVGGQELYRGRFVPKPDDNNFRFMTIHATPEAGYQSRQTMARQQNLKQISLSVVTIGPNERKYCSTWVQQPFPVFWRTGLLEKQVGIEPSISSEVSEIDE